MASRKISVLPPSYFRTSKRFMKGKQIASVEAKIAEESKYFDAMLTAPEAKEDAFADFFEKRKSDFSQFA